MGSRLLRMSSHSLTVSPLLSLLSICLYSASVLQSFPSTKSKHQSNTTHISQSQLTLLKAHAFTTLLSALQFHRQHEEAYRVPNLLHFTHFHHHHIAYSISPMKTSIPGSIYHILYSLTQYVQRYYLNSAIIFLVRIFHAILLWQD